MHTRRILAAALMVAAAALGAASCAKQDAGVGGAALDVELTVEAYPGSKTVTDMTGADYATSFAAGDSVGVTLYNSDGILADNVAYAYDAAADKWTTTGRLLYREGCSYLVYYPYSRRCSGITTVSGITAVLRPEPDQGTAEGIASSDVLTGSGVLSGGTLEATMRHAYSLIELKLYAGRYLESGESDVWIPAKGIETVSISDGRGNKYTAYTKDDSTYVAVVLPGTKPEVKYTADGVQHRYSSSGAVSAGTRTTLRTSGGVTITGEGTSTSPYHIFTAGQLRRASERMNSGTSSYLSARYILESDIDLNPGITIAQDGKCTDSSGAAASPCEWTAVGTMSARFTGEFDGNGHTVRGVYIDKPGSDYQGLFGVIGSGGEVKDLTVKESFIRGGKYVGGVCGLNDGGTITNCTVSGAVTSTGNYAGGVCGLNDGGTITNCTVSGAVTSTGNVAGGVCGYNNSGTITNCTGSGSVSGSSSVGGVCGLNEGGTVANCTGSGAVSGRRDAGGVCGYNSGTITNCISSGAVTSTGNVVGGVCGLNSATIKNCYYDSTVYTGSGSGEAIGLPTATMTSTTETVGEGTYSSKTLLGALKAGAAAYNAASPAPSVKACSWKQTSGKRPELDFTATP
jgi:hypothetical protein